MLYQALVAGKLVHANEMKRGNIGECPLCGATVQVVGPRHKLNGNSWLHPENGVYDIDCIHGETERPGYGYRHFAN